MILKNQKLIILSLIFLYTSATWAMEDDPNPRVPPKTIHLIIPPEQHQLMQQRQLIALRYPHLAFPVPPISSQSEFEIAKKYLKLSMQNDDILYRACLSTAGQPHYPNLRILSEQALKEVHAYHATLYGESCRAFRSQQDDEELKKSHYDIHYRIAQNLLMFITDKILHLPYEMARVQVSPFFEPLKNIEDMLRESPEHRKNLKSAIASLENTVPGIRSLFHPNEIRTNPVQSQKLSKKVVAYKTVKFNNNLLNEVNKGFPELNQDEALENFDVQFKMKTRELLTQYLDLSTKTLPSEDYRGKVEALMDKYIALEKKGIQFNAFLSSSPVLPVEKLTVDVLTSLHRFLQGRYTLGQQSTLRLLENSIFMCIDANKVEDALMRLEALKNLLPEKVTHSLSFIALRANILALNGNFEEWRRLLMKRQEKTEVLKSQQRQNIVQQIKSKQEEYKKSQEQEEAQRQERAREKEKIAEVKKLAAIQYAQNNQETTQGVSDVGFSMEKEKYTITFPREKPKTHKLGSERTTQETISVTEQPTPPAQPLKDYIVSKPALATYRKIREGIWHFPRKDLYNLFDKLGCKIDIEQGKGDHGMIHLPLTMTIHDMGGLVAVLPEFMTKKEENTPLRPMTIPNWDEKWDGRVPPYMRNSILRALDYLGATDATVHR